MRKSSKLTIRNHYNKFIGSLTKNGNKVAAKNILTSAIKNIFLKKKMDIDYILALALKDLQTNVEVRKSVRGAKRKMRITLIPFPLSKKRQVFFKIKWIIKAAKENRKNISFSQKLTDELLNLIYDKKKSKALAKKKESKDAILANKSNSHYRW